MQCALEFTARCSTQAQSAGESISNKDLRDLEPFGSSLEASYEKAVTQLDGSAVGGHTHLM